MMSPLVDEIADEYEGKAVIGKLNVDENPETCEQFGIMSIPTMLFFRNGEVVDKQIGAAPKAAFEAKIQSLLN
jgi:thioredoxin 1